jgi:capsular exopolysaccharide synthesis family protein
VLRQSDGRVAAQPPLPADYLNDEVLTYHATILRGIPWPGSGRAEDVRTLGVTSCQLGEGVSTIAGRLAVAAACSGPHRVLLVDANLRRPSLHRTFKVRPKPGLAEVLLGGRLPEDIVQPSSVSRLSILAAGKSNGRIAAAYHVEHLPELIEMLGSGFDLVVFDLPPAGQEGSVIRLAGLLDGVLLVVEAERGRWETARRVRQLLERADTRLLGAVLNKRRRHIPGWVYRRL